MPIHLTGIETVVSLPDPSQYEPGYPVIHDGVIKVVNEAATPGWDEVGGSSIALIGNPIQTFGGSNVRPGIIGPYTGISTENNSGETDIVNIPQPSIGLTFTNDFGGIAETRRWEWPALTDGVTNTDAPTKSTLIVRWHVPVTSTLSVQKHRFAVSPIETTFTAVLDGGQLFQDVDTAQDTPVAQTFTVEPGLHTLELTYEITSGTGDITTGLQAYFDCQAQTEPDDGSVWFDDVSGTYVEYDTDANAMFPRGGRTPAHGNSWVYGRIQTLNDVITNNGQGSVVVGDAFTSGDDGGFASVGSRNWLRPNSYGGGGDYHYDGYVFGIGSQVSSYAVGIGYGADVSTEGIGIGNYAYAGQGGIALGPDTTATGFDSSAQSQATTPGVSVAAGTGTAFGRYQYYVRGVNALGNPTTRWSPSGNIDVSSGEDVTVTWVQGDYPAGTVEVEVFRAKPNFYADVVGTVLSFVALATETYTDNFSILETTIRSSNYASTKDTFSVPATVAIGKYSVAQHARAIMVGDQLASDRDGHVQIGDNETEFVHPGGVTERVESVSVAHTIDGDGTFGHIILADASGGAFNVTLPDGPRAGRVCIVKNVGASGTVTVVTPNAETIDGAASNALATQYDSIKVVYDGTNWMII